MADGLLDPYPANGGAKQKQHEDWYADYSQRPMTPRDKSPRGVSPGGRSPSARSPRATSPFSNAVIMPRDAERAPRKLILCFDGTGNKFHGDESDSNILKIFRMLDRSAGDQYHYYQRESCMYTHDVSTPYWPLTLLSLKLALAHMSSRTLFLTAAYELALARGIKRPRILPLARRLINMLSVDIAS